ncbi:serine hydrolase domain-containing protein [Chloroflexus sp.]|uniref:serine hydrolase domain-containing protein n=1 Tax=Chloroflexus sp. TaxID=1904827 RepID=UPI002632EABA|nr:serine hydrolase domain-containing protein [uncultured Chloroflexus sp.]
MLAAIDDLIATAIHERVFPGAVVIVARADHPIHAAAYGATMYDDSGSQPVTLDTVYDLASLTKVFTALAALRLHDAGMLPLDRPVQHWLPALRASDITARHLLSHCSGLAVQLAPLARQGAAAIRQAVYNAIPKHPAGQVTEYANLNTLLLGDLVATVYDGSLDAAIEELVCAPLGMQHTCFRPPVAWLQRTAPTEWDYEWRAGLVHGVVHDESAYALGGVAGHAGLFGIATEAIRLVQLFLQEGSWQGKQLLRAETARAALTPQAQRAGQPVSGLGWMLQRPYMGAAMAAGFGHSGFTGPIMMGIPTEALAIVALCNRTYPRRTPPPYRHHQVFASIVDTTLHAIESKLVS